jgi:perosamine synthetase
MEYPIYTPDISNYTTSILSALQDGWISSQGSFIEKARDKASSVIGSPYVVLVNNGTSATHLLYKSLKFKHPTLQRIYVPDYVFAAVWNCALYEYSSDMITVLPTDPKTLNPVFPDTFPPNSALVVVHNIGNVVNVPALKRRHPDLVIVEDCCEAFLEEYEGQKTGTASLCGAVSFFGNKIITTGEGGLWYTNDKDLYDFIYKSCHHGMTSERYVYDVLGYNYRMTNLQAGLLYDQLCDVDAILDRKRKVRDTYSALFPGWMVTTGLWMNVLRIPGVSYCTVAATLREYGIDTRPMFYPIHTHAHLRTIAAVSTPIEHSELLMIPSSPTLSAYDQVYIAKILHSIVNGHVPPIVHRITSFNRSKLDRFVAQELPSSFRYFTTRTADTCFQTHTLTLIASHEGVDVGYAHLDDRWIGVCILPEYQGRGYGSFLLDFVIEFARTAGISQVRLTVDVTNDIAYAMYLRHGFVVQERTDAFYRMTKDL